MMKKNIDTATQNVGLQILKLIKKLYPICRSITGNGTLQTLNIINQILPLTTHEIPSGTEVLDWTVPKEWNITDAYIKDSKGNTIVDFKTSNLHVVGYSTAIHRKLTLEELRKHLYSLPDFPEWIPYLTSYYKKHWGFCVQDNILNKLRPGMYEVFINSKHSQGVLIYGEVYIPGKSKEEIVLSSYICHPSMCNDNLSGVALLTYLGKALLKTQNKYSYRLLFIPETIGAITWLANNKETIKKIKHGLVLTCLGDRGPLTYKRSRQGNAEIDQLAEKMLIDANVPFSIVNFNPASGSDERQYCSPAFNLPVGSLMRSMYGTFPEYHTSADNLSFMSEFHLKDSYEKYVSLLHMLEVNCKYISTCQKGEPQLSKRGLFRTLGSQKQTLSINDKAIFWVLNYSDGLHSLLDIARLSELPFQQIEDVAVLLNKNKLLKKCL